MASSGTFTFSLSVDEMITEAIERNGKDPQNLTGYVADSAIRSFNLLFAEWETRQIRYWNVETATEALTAGIAGYDLDTKVLGILTAVIRRDGVDRQLNRLGMQDYFEKPDKSSQAPPSEFCFDRQLTPRVLLYPTPDSASDSLRMLVLRQLQDISALAQDPEAPKRWAEAICSGLAAKLAEKLQTPTIERLELKAERALMLAVGDEGERAGISIRPRGLVRRR